ncbi:hypothetical protein [Sinorhizobium meliloti]|uniref:hypothetical protein n=1 Tax=Rhizobium meliloti TaxID=382 RepID=UPI0012948C7D|nr:hypothetical protein [Sinorhizobium meliloti]MDW9491745.1 hypothetical protein [Sinorhizobium meliloti]MQV03011.1 hypothetical protein [Sinorhizobium meliloti]
MTIHTPKAFLRGRNGINRPHSTYLNLLNAKFLTEALKEREAWDKTIDANKLTDRKGNRLKNPITKYRQLHATKGYRLHTF